MKFKSVPMINLALILLVHFVAFAACSANDQGDARIGPGLAKMSGTPAALTSEAARILGFEDATADWTVISGTSTDHSEGTVSGQVNVTGWMQITSVPLSSIAQEGIAIGESAAIDVKLPEAASWGEVRLIMDLPSQGIWWQDLGGARLEDLNPGEFREVSFSLPAEVSSALSAVYTDLTLVLIINGPAMSAPILIDHLQFEGIDMGVDTEVTAVPFQFELPESVALRSVVAQTSESLHLANVVHAASSVANVINMGSGATYIGIEAEIDGNIYAGGETILDDRSTIHGFVQAAGNVDIHDGVVVDYGSVGGTPLTVGTQHQWNADWPVVNGVYTVNDGDTLDLAPGNYTSVTLNSNGVLNLSAGTYFFDNFVAHAGTVINISGNNTPVIVYVRDSFTCRAALNHSHSSSDFFVGFAGQGTVDLDGPFAGTVVAPNATIRFAPLNGGSHEGSFFAKSIWAEANTPINRVPFDHWDDILPDSGTSIPVEPPRILPTPPTEVGCYVGTVDGWELVPCGTDIEPPIMAVDEWAIRSTPVDPNDDDSAIPIQFGQVETTLIATKGVTDVSPDPGIQPKENNFSVQLNTNRFFAKAGKYTDEGDEGVVQLGLQQLTIGGEHRDVLCIWQINRTKACGVGPDEPCPPGPEQDTSHYHWHCFDTALSGDRIGTRSGGLKEFDFASLAISTYSDSGGTPVIGLVAQFSWVDLDWRNWLTQVAGDDIYDKTNGTFAIVQEDYISLRDGLTEVSGDFFGLGDHSEAQFEETTALTRVLAGSCANAPGPIPDVPWPGVCPDQFPPLINTSIVDSTKITAETNNLIIVNGPTELVSVTNDFVYMQYLQSTSGLCDTDVKRVYVKDTASDVGVSPSNYGKEPYWNSPDIFVVPAGTPVTVNAIASEALLAPGETYDFYIRVHNDYGCDAVTGVKTKIYIADPSLLSAAWENVTGGAYVGGPSTGGITVDPGTSALIGPISWTAPTDAAADGHKCVLASIISDNQDAPVSVYDAPASHQVAQRNVQFSDCAFPLTNATDEDGYLSLSFTIEGAMPALGSNTNQIEVTFEDSNSDMYSVWETGEGADYDVTHSNGETTVRFASRHVILDPVEFADGRSIDATGSIVLLQGEPRTHLAMEAKLYDGLDADDGLISQNGASCEKSGIVPE